MKDKRIIIIAVIVSFLLTGCSKEMDSLRVRTYSVDIQGRTICVKPLTIQETDDFAKEHADGKEFRLVSEEEWKKKFKKEHSRSFHALSIRLNRQ